ncbi:MAG TPA: hypothetical protein VME44_06355 [Streptosporangiaceae bacterium]|nr:hypothetical protein [Streptosporangiaceae bacterium]
MNLAAGSAGMRVRTAGPPTGTGVATAALRDRECMVSERVRRAAGTRSGWQTVLAGFRPPSAAATRADLEALERGEARAVACFFRGSAEPYPGRFVFRQLVLAPRGLTLWPLWFTPDRKVIRIGEDVLSAHVRPRNPNTDRKIRSAGNYRPGRPLGYAGSSVVLAETSNGWLEFGVPNPDVPLVLAYFQRHRTAAADGQT